MRTKLISLLVVLAAFAAGCGQSSDTPAATIAAAAQSSATGEVGDTGDVLLAESEFCSAAQAAVSGFDQAVTIAEDLAAMQAEGAEPDGQPIFVGPTVDVDALQSLLTELPAEAPSIVGFYFRAVSEVRAFEEGVIDGNEATAAFVTLVTINATDVDRYLTTTCGPQAALLRNGDPGNVEIVQPDALVSPTSIDLCAHVAELAEQMVAIGNAADPTPMFPDAGVIGGNVSAGLQPDAPLGLVVVVRSLQAAARNLEAFDALESWSADAALDPFMVALSMVAAVGPTAENELEQIVDYVATACPTVPNATRWLERQSEFSLSLIHI